MSELEKRTPYYVLAYIMRNGRCESGRVVEACNGTTSGRVRPPPTISGLDISPRCLAKTVVSGNWLKILQTFGL